MSHAIIVERLSKRYTIGERRDDLIQERLARWLRRPFTTNGGSRSSTIWALKDISVQVEDGEVLGIVEPTAPEEHVPEGLSRITYPTSGEMKSRAGVAALLEVGTGFHGDLTGRENIFLNGSILGMSRKEIARSSTRSSDFAGVETFLDTPVKRYSSGMYLRLGFAVAAHLEPDVLLVDEVLAVGDAAFQKKCLNAMGADAQTAAERCCSCRTTWRRSRTSAPVLCGSIRASFASMATQGRHLGLPCGLGSKLRA